MSKIKAFVSARKKALLMAAMPAATAMMAVVPAFATPAIDADGVIDPTLFDPLVTGVTGNIGAVMPKLLIIVAMLVGIGVVIALVKKNARPN